MLVSVGRSQVLNMEVQVAGVVDMTRRVARVSVQVVDAVLVEGGRMRAAEDVVQAGRVGQTEDAVPG